MTHPVSVRVSRKVGLKFSNFRHFCNYHDRETCNPKNECAQIYFVQIFLKASAAKSTFMIGPLCLPAVRQKFSQARLHHQTPHPIDSSMFGFRGAGLSALRGGPLALLKI